MRKIVRMLTLILVLCTLVTVAAAQETAYVVEELDLSIAIPEGMEVYDKTTIDQTLAENQELVEALELTEMLEEDLAYLEFFNADVMETGKLFLCTVGMQETELEDGQPTSDFGQMTEEELDLVVEFYQAVYGILEEEGFSTKVELVQTEQTPYLEVVMKITEEGETFYCVVYTTIYRDKTYIIVFLTNNGRQEKQMDSILASVRLEQSVWSPTGFADMAGHWAEDSVLAAVEQGLFSGTSPDTFSPDAPMTRAMLVQVLYRLEGEPEAQPAAFADVAADDWFADAVAWASENGIVLGSDGKFDPDGILTREQLAAILWRYAQYDKQDVSVGEDTNILSYNDASTISEYAIPAMQWTCGAGLMEGVGEGYLAPRGTTTRAQVATILARYLQK